MVPMYNILTLNKIAKTGLARLGENYVCGDAVENPDAIMVRSAAFFPFANMTPERGFAARWLRLFPFPLKIHFKGATVPESDTVELTERSIPPETITNVMPTARMALIEAWRKTPIMLNRVKKFSLLKLKATQIMASPIKAINSRRFVRLISFVLSELFI